jgi:magnesium-transporting ATPase (P-type)
VPADVRLIQVQSTALKVEQAALTGEAASVNKNVAYVSQSSDEVLVQKENMMFAATDVVYGKCQGVVVRTGKATEIGKIAQALTETEDQDSPLKEKLDQFGELLTDVIKWICVACWLVNVPNCSKKGMALTGKTKADWNVWLKGAMHFFKIAVTLAVAAIPEGLPAVVTTCLALGTRRMAAKNALVRHLPAVETLGCTSVICSDKTGTLTTNQMSVQRVLLVGKDSKLVELEVEGITYEPKGRARRLDTQEAVTSADYVSLNEVSSALLANLTRLANRANIHL